MTVAGQDNHTNSALTGVWGTSVLATAEVVLLQKRLLHLARNTIWHLQLARKMLLHVAHNMMRLLGVMMRLLGVAHIMDRLRLACKRLLHVARNMMRLLGVVCMMGRLRLACKGCCM